MPLSKPQQQIFDDPTRFRVAVCGRRFGKTWLAQSEIAKVVRYPGKNVYVVYPTYRQAKTVMWDQLKEKLIRINWASKVNETDLSITLRNNSKVSLRGADNFDSLRGIGLDACILDEFQLIDPKAWNEVLRPALSDKEGTALFIGTPYGTANYAFDLYQRGKDVNEPHWNSYSFTTIDGGNVSAEEIEQARRDLDERTFKQEYLASFETYANRIFYAFSRTENVKRWDKPIPDTLYVSFDFNIDPMSLCVFAMEGNVAHAIDEVCIYSSNTQEAIDELRARYPKQKIFAYPDPACRQRKTSAGGATDLSIMTNNGLLVKCLSTHNPIREGINAVNRKLCNSKGERSLFFDPKCKKSIESMEKHTYKEGTSQPDKDSGLDHMSDSIRYFVEYVFPLKRNVVEQAPQRFGHSIG